MRRAVCLGVLVLAWCVFVLAGDGARAQDRSYEDKLPTPGSDLEHLSGSKPRVSNWYQRLFEPRRGGRRPLHVPFPEGESDTKTITLNADQYYLDFEFDDPRSVTVRLPDDKTVTYWYFLFRVKNFAEYPVYARLSFKLKTMDENLIERPEDGLKRLTQEEKEALLDRFIGSKETRQKRGLAEPKTEAELLRGIFKSHVFEYVNYPDRRLMNLICTRERRWEYDSTGHQFNSLVPAHYFQWRKRLMVAERYEYPEVTVDDVIDRTSWRIRPEYVGPDETKITVRAMSYAVGGEPAAPEISNYASLEAFMESPLGQKKVRTAAPGNLLGEPAEMTLWEAFMRGRPRYRKGDRVDMYGFQLAPGHPAFERGRLIDTAEDLGRLHGAIAPDRAIVDALWPPKDELAVEKREPVVFVKHPAARRYRPEDKVLVNYKLPLRPSYNPDQNRRIGDDKPTDRYEVVNGEILDAYEYEPEEGQWVKRSEINRYGGVRDYGTSLVSPSRDVPWFVDGQWQRVKRLDSRGRSLFDDIRLYQPGDRVTPIEWKVYASQLAPPLLEEYKRRNAYNPNRKYVQFGDLLVGKPRLMLAEYGEETITVNGREYTMARGASVRGFTAHDGEWWRWGFRVDAAGDFAALVWEDLNKDGQDRFERLLQEGKLRPVPVFDALGTAVDFVNPITHERRPARDEQGNVKTDSGGNTVWVKRYAALPHYLYQYDYVRISATEADAAVIEQEGAEFRLDDLVDDYKQDANPRSGAHEIPFDKRYDDGSGQADRDVQQRIDGYYDPVRQDDRFARAIEGQFRTGGRPTLGPRRINVNHQPGDTVVLEKHPSFMREVIVDENDPERITVVMRRDPDSKERGVVYTGRKLSETALTLTLELETELIPAFAEGVAIFREIDRQWDWMNVYVSGTKGPIRRDGFNSFDYDTIPSNVDNETTPETVTRTEHSPRYVKENWVLMLRWNRPGDEFFTDRDPVRFVRRFFFLKRTESADGAVEDPEIRLRGQ